MRDFPLCTNYDKDTGTIFNITQVILQDTADVKREAVQLWQTSGKTAAEIKQELGINAGLPGRRRIHRQLQREGEGVGENTVAKYMRQMGIRAIYPGPNLSKRTQNASIYPYLLRNMTAGYPNHIWGIDITYIRLQRGWLYLVAIVKKPAVFTGHVRLDVYRLAAREAYGRLSVLNPLQTTMFADEDAFVDTFVSGVERRIPSAADIRASFYFNVELNYVPLPSLMAAETAEAERVSRKKSWWTVSSRTWWHSCAIWSGRSSR